jgi:transcriptional regulator with XRE-family HTH domain
VFGGGFRQVAWRGRQGWDFDSGDWIGRCVGRAVETGRNADGRGAVAEVLGIDQPKVSALVRGQFRGYSLERLFKFLNAFDLNVEVSVKSKPEDRERNYTIIGS